MDVMLPPTRVTSDDVLSFAANDALPPPPSQVPLAFSTLNFKNVEMDMSMMVDRVALPSSSPATKSNKISRSCELKTTDLDSRRVSASVPVPVPLVIPEQHTAVHADENGTIKSNGTTASAITAITVKHTDLRLKDHGDDDDTCGSIDSSESEEDVDNDDDASIRRKKIAIELSRKKIIACPASWECLKCSYLNSHRARSCESCDEKKPVVKFTNIKAHAGRGVGRPRVIINGTAVIVPKKSHKKVVRAVV